MGLCENILELSLEWNLEISSNIEKFLLFVEVPNITWPLVVFTLCSLSPSICVKMGSFPLLLGHNNFFFLIMIHKSDDLNDISLGDWLSYASNLLPRSHTSFLLGVPIFCSNAEWAPSLLQSHLYSADFFSSQLMLDISVRYWCCSLKYINTFYSSGRLDYYLETAVIPAGGVSDKDCNFPFCSSKCNEQSVFLG